MSRHTQLKRVNPVVVYPAAKPLSEIAPSKPSKAFDLTPAPPHTLIERGSSYSIVFNMLGVEQNGVGIDINPGKREVTVLARRERENFRNGFFWIFGVPRDALLAEMTARFKTGVLEIVIPKISRPILY
jgi:HSP20 family molecular chaperone IbpA